MRLLFFLGLFFCLAASPINIIYVDEATERKLGDFPISRDHYAKAIEVLNSTQHPRMIVIKIFLDLPKKEDQVLLTTLKKHHNVYTQALAVDEEIQGKLPLRSLGKNSMKLTEYKSAWVPMGELGLAFKGIGLVNGSTNEKDEAIGFYLVNAIQGEVYPSLPLLLAHEYLVRPLKFSKSYMALPPLPKVFPWKTYSFLDLIEGKIKSNELKDKIVMIFYKGKKAEPMTVVGGRKANQAELIALLTDTLLEKMK